MQSLSITFPMHDGRSCLLILSLTDPLALECLQRRQNRTTEPSRQTPLLLYQCHYVDLHCGGSQTNHLLIETLRQTLKHWWPSIQHNASIKFLSYIKLALLDWLKGELMQTRHQSSRSKKVLWALKDLRAESNFLPVRQIIVLWFMLFWKSWINDLLQLISDSKSKATQHSFFIYAKGESSSEL